MNYNNIAGQQQRLNMKTNPISFKGNFIVPNNELNKKINFLYPKVLRIGKRIQAPTLISNDKITIQSYKSKDNFVRKALKRLGVEFKEEKK